MIRAYRIGVEIAATNSVSPVLRLITKDLLGVGREADHLAGKFTAVKIAAMGAFAAMGGVAIIGATMKLAEYGNKLAEVQSRLRQMGVTAPNVGKMTNAAFTQSMRTPNVDYADALAALMKTRTVLGSSKEAIKAAHQRSARRRSPGHRNRGCRIRTSFRVRRLSGPFATTYSESVNYENSQRT